MRRVRTGRLVVWADDHGVCDGNDLVPREIRRSSVFPDCLGARCLVNAHGADRPVWFGEDVLRIQRTSSDIRSPSAVKRAAARSRFWAVRQPLRRRMTNVCTFGPLIVTRTMRHLRLREIGRNAHVGRPAYASSSRRRFAVTERAADLESTSSLRRIADT